MEIVIAIVALAFIFEFMDSSAGMGFGTSLTPLLFIMGFNPLQVVPVVLASEAITGFVSGFFHHEFGNVKFSVQRPFNKATRLVLLIAVSGCFAIVLSVFLAYFAINLPKDFIKLYVAVLVLLMGVYGIIRLKFRTSKKFRPKLLAGFACLAGFNKGIGGGGYGPVVTLGQIFSGVHEKSAVAIVSVAEAFVSVFGVLTFIFISSMGKVVDFSLLPSIFTGAFVAAILSPYIVRVFPTRWWRKIIPVYAFSLGSYLSLKIAVPGVF